MEEPTIRAYEERDWPQIERIHDASRRTELAYAGLSDAFLPLAVAAKREGLFDDRVVVALLEGVVVGFAAYTEDELAWLYVDPVRTRQGVGRALVSHVIAHTTARPLQLELLSGNEPAFLLYQSMGFVPAGLVHGRMPGNESFAVVVQCMTLDERR